MFVLFTIKKVCSKWFQCSSCTKDGAVVLRPHGRHNQNKTSSTEEDVTAVSHCRGSPILSYLHVSDIILFAKMRAAMNGVLGYFFSTNKCKPRVDYAVCFSLSRCHDLCFIRDRIPSCSVE